MQSSSLGYKVSVGLEVHIGVGTKSKLFSSALNARALSYPNSQISFYDLALPGTLPVLDVGCITKAALFGVLTYSFQSGSFCFVRKHYGYPDLPKGYQLSQLGEGLSSFGRVWLGGQKFSYFCRCFIEEDAGKIHYDRPFIKTSGIDFNRAGTPLLEVVTPPLFRSASEALLFVRKLRQLVLWAAISWGSLEDGQFRFDVNVSLSCTHSLGGKVEVKNLNSFQSLKGSLDFEVKRQFQVLQTGRAVLSETRLYETQTQQTFVIRKKEAQADYCFLFDPDLLPLPTGYFLGAPLLENSLCFLLVHWGLIERFVGAEFGFNQSYLALLVLVTRFFLILRRFQFVLGGARCERFLFLFLFSILQLSGLGGPLLLEVELEAEKFVSDFRGKAVEVMGWNLKLELGGAGSNKNSKWQFQNDFGLGLTKKVHKKTKRQLGLCWLKLGLGLVVEKSLDFKKICFLSET
ncbi:glutamyl-tRNA(Gln) amidotransferase, B subunit [Candidatus Tremblaya phenacola PAVE]|nr:glutamyl-tRNA(Gln) amidotransferase, B subunit [Candidatus Tremblaya phenacola PAVE]